MKRLPALRNFYKPLQPAVQSDHKDISYIEWPPPKEIENYVYCFWQLKTSTPLQYPFQYRVVSDGCIDIFFNHKKTEENFVMGFHRKFTEFTLGQNFDYIGIRFLPSAFTLLYGVDAKTLSNQSQKLLPVLPEFSKWIVAHINSTHSFDKIRALLSDKLRMKIENQDSHYDHRFFDSLNLIFQKNGFLDTEKDLKTGLSPRQLRRIFNFYIGVTPKAFCNVVRFQYILKAKPSTQNLKEEKLYYDVGFFDQSHFIKHFKTFYGVSPSEAFNKS